VAPPWGSAGWICAAQAGPLPEPEALRYGLRSLVDRTSALYVDPRRLPLMAPWLMRFARACTAKRHAAGVRTLATFEWRAFALVDELTAEGAAFGRTSRASSSPRYGSGRCGTSSTDLDSGELATAIAALLRRAGVTIEEQTNALEIVTGGVRTEAGFREADAVVLSRRSVVARAPPDAGRGP
jgi:hypothetical protein